MDHDDRPVTAEPGLAHDLLDLQRLLAMAERPLAAHDDVAVPARPVVIGVALLDVDAFDQRTRLTLLAALRHLDRAIGLRDREHALLTDQLLQAAKAGLARRDPIDRHLVELLICVMTSQRSSACAISTGVLSLN
jgi:hypothetical protein